MSATLPEGAASYSLEGQPDAKQPRHIAVLPHAATADNTVPALIQGGLTPEMVVVADMLYKNGPRLAQEVNIALAAHNCPPYRSVSDVIEKVQDPDTSAAQKAKMLAALESALRPYMAPDASLEVLMDEWIPAVVWMDICIACAYPRQARLEEEGGAADVQHLASSQSEHAPVHLLISTLLNAKEQLFPV